MWIRKEEIVVSKPKSTAAAKTKDLDAVSPKEKKQEPTEAAKAKEISDAEIKEPASKKDILKTQKVAPSKDKEKQGTKFAGIRKMFNRKSSGK